MWPFSKPESYLGVDIGSYGIKLVEVQKKNKRAYLYTYAYSTKNLTAGGDSFLDIDVAANLLKEMCQKSKTVSKQALASLPASTVYNFLITIPNLRKDEEKEFIRRQAQKFLPVPLEEVQLDWRIIQRKDQAQGKKQNNKIGGKEVLFYAAPKKIIASYTEIFKKAGLTLLSLESETFSLISALIGKDPSPILLIDFGAAQTDFIFVEYGVPILFHSINLGGQSFTEVIEQTMGVAESEAEQIKHDLKSEPSFPVIFEPLLKPIEEAVHYINELYAKQKEDSTARPEKIILTGGSSLLPHLDTRLSNLFNIKVYLGDPWARIIYDDSLKPTLDGIGPRFAVTLGLALKKIEG
ncbi:MAG: pilus assembly protein PilM [Patescibacteria group bacterium]